MIISFCPGNRAMINFKCKKCKEAMESPDSLGGQPLLCPICKTQTIVPKAKYTPWMLGDVIVMIMFDYYELTGSSIAAYEHTLFQMDPEHIDRGLLYALRVSHCVPKINTFNKLSSCYETALKGPRLNSQYCLESAKDSDLYEKVRDFIHKLYGKRFIELLNNIIQKTNSEIEHRKTNKAKYNSWDRAFKKLLAANTEFYFATSTEFYFAEYCDNHFHNLLMLCDKNRNKYSK